jgi:putative ABC transport system permease protein
MKTLLQDIRYALRSFGKARAFTIAAVLTIALGIGANTAIFSVVHSVLFRALPFRAPEQLVRVWPNSSSSRAEYAEVRAKTRLYQDIAAVSYLPAGATLVGRGEPERIAIASATSNLFPVLGIAPALGRNFTATEERAGNDNVVMLSHDLWQRRFGSDPAIVGRTITLDGVGRTVVGVMPADFHFPRREVEAWVPVVMDASNVGDFWGSGGYAEIGRLRPGATAASAQDELRSVARQIRHDNPVWDPGASYGIDASVVSLQKELAGDVRPTLLILLAAVAVVLLIACANVANLLLARGAARTKAFAIRAAVGARRRRLVQQLLTESLLLAGIGALAGFILAWVIVAPLSRGLLADTPQLFKVSIDGRVLAFTAAIAVITGVLTGIVPALRASDPNFNTLLNDASRGASSSFGHRRLSDALVVLEVALAVTLVIGAGLLIRSFWELSSIAPGFDPVGVTAARVDLPKQGQDKEEHERVFYSQMVRRLAELPGVRSAAATSEIPLGERSGMAFRVGGQIEDIHHGLPTANGYHVVTPAYLRTMGITLRHGRSFTDADARGAPDVAIVNEALARRFWPNGDAIGQRIGYPWDSPWITIVGVAADIHEQGLGVADTTMTIYRPFLQAPKPNMQIVVKSNLPTTAVAADIRRVVTDLDRTAPVSHVQSMEQVVSTSTAKPRFTMLLLSGFAAVALLLGAIGIYGVISYAVEQRNKEVGIRMALGAQESSVLNLVLRRGMVLAATGALVGLILSLATTRSLASVLYGVKTFDPATFVVAPVLLVAVALLASYIPARRAASVDPVTVLNAE